MKIKVIRDVMKQTMYTGFWDDAKDLTYVSYENRKISEEVLFEGDIDSPPLVKEDEFYISSINETVSIKKVTRTTDNGYLIECYSKKYPFTVEEKAEYDKLNTYWGSKREEHNKNKSEVTTLSLSKVKFEKLQKNIFGKLMLKIYFGW